MNVSVIILTFNSRETIQQTLDSARRITDDIHVVDSFSTDETVALATAAGARVVQHEFENYGAQRNWAIENLPLKYDWELHLDADERLSDELVAEIGRLNLSGRIDGYFVPRLIHFLGRPIRHGAMYPIWHMRLFRHGRGRCENRRYDQHFIAAGETDRLNAPMIDDIRMPLGEWVNRHNRWADAEVDEIIAGRNPEADDGLVSARARGNPIERQRAKRQRYDRMPLFLRAFLLFLYRYVFRLGFLDGKEGLVFFVLQTFWFRFLIDAKLFEGQRLAAADDSAQAPAQSTRT